MTPSTPLPRSTSSECRTDALALERATWVLHLQDWQQNEVCALKLGAGKTLLPTETTNFTTDEERVTVSRSKRENTRHKKRGHPQGPTR